MIKHIPSHGTSRAARRLAALVAAFMVGAAWLVPAPARADNLGGGIGLATDKVVRGISQSGAQPSLLLDLVYRTDSRWSFSLGAASLGLGSLARNGRSTGSNSEVYLAVTRSWQLNPDWTGQIGGTAYSYPGSRDPFYGDYLEFGGSVAWRGALSLALAATPSISGRDRSGGPRRGSTGALELGAHTALGGRWGLDAGLGLADVTRLGNRRYTYGSAGVSWSAGSSQLFASWITSRADELNGVAKRVAGDRLVVSLWWSF